MKVIFLDFDGVLNSEGSFSYEERLRKKFKKEFKDKPTNQTLCNVCTSNFQMILEHYPKVKIVISSTWRELYSLDWLKEKLALYGIDSSRVIDSTIIYCNGINRGLEIKIWLDEHPQVKHYIIIDDNDWNISQIHGTDKFVKTTWEIGLTYTHALEAIEKLKTTKKSTFVGTQSNLLSSSSLKDSSSK